MKVASLLDKTVIIVRRDLLTTVRYRTGFLLAAAGAITELAAFYYLSIAVGPDFRPEGFEYFSFLLVGTGFYTFLLMGVHAFLQTVQEAQQTGTLEVLMTTSTAPPVLVFLSAMSAFAANTVTLLFLLTLRHHCNLYRTSGSRIATSSAERLGGCVGPGFGLVSDRPIVPGAHAA